jgi:prolipoprotein diacylglyceryltransferase
VAEKQVKKTGGNPEILYKIIWGSILAGLLGARLSYIARNVGAFAGQWRSVLSLNPALLDPAGGVLITFAVGYFLAVRANQANLSLLDKLVPFAATLVPAIFLANFAAGAGFGTLTELPWGVELWGGQRHPVQLYYFVSSLGVLYWLVIKQAENELRAGSKMVSFFLYTSGYITFFSSFQDPGNNVIHGFRLLQLSAWIILVLSIVIYTIRYQKGVNHASR